MNTTSASGWDSGLPRRALAVLGIVAAAGTAFGQAGAQPAAAPAAATAPAPADAAPGASDLGDIEVIPVRANLILFRYGQQTCGNSVVRFRLRNKSAGDVKVVLFRANFSATDANGGALFRNNRDFTTGGIGISEAPAQQLQSAFTKERGKLVSLAPRQVVEVQVTTTPRQPQCVPDAGEEMMRSYRPKTMSLSATLGVVDVSGTPDVKTVSLLDVPLQVATR